MQEKSRREENSEATRKGLVEAARKLFTERGYADTSTEEIVRRSRVTRGALYHHFTGKRDLFRAVLQEVNGGVSESIAGRALQEGEVWEGVVQGIDAFLDACIDPAYQRIVLLDGPAVLGWEEWREIGEHHGLGIIRAALVQAVEQGVIEPQPIEPLAHMLHGALNEAGMHIARSSDPEAARAEAGASVFRLIEGLKTPVAKAGRAARR
ncbi:MAG TPA: TetR/AcrR family transcriptional regulator [Actinomycetota bacterium]